MTLYLSEQDVESLVGPDDALTVIEASCRRSADEPGESSTRSRVAVGRATLTVEAAADAGLDSAGVLATANGRAAAAVLVLFDANGDLTAVVEGPHLARLRTGAASALAARRLARPDARTLGVIGCGGHARWQVRCLRAALPRVERVVAYCRTPERLADFCARTGAEEAGSGREAAGQDVVVTATTSRDPVVRGEWLAPGALVCAVGATARESRELDNAVVERTAFVCCDSKPTAEHDAGDLREPVEQGVLDWLEVHELAEVVTGAVVGRQAASDIVLFKSIGAAAWDIALAAYAVGRARESGVGRTL